MKFIYISIHYKLLSAPLFPIVAQVFALFGILQRTHRRTKIEIAYEAASVMHGSNPMKEGQERLFFGIAPVWNRPYGMMNASRSRFEVRVEPS